MDNAQNCDSYTIYISLSQTYRSEEWRLELRTCTVLNVCIFATIAVVCTQARIVPTLS
jgi:hypothetical protein